jgi:hypothetical protein
MPTVTSNGLAIAGSLFMLSGLAILGAALLNRTGLAKVSNSTLLNPEKLHIAAWFALPMIASGLFLQAAGNLAGIPLGTGLSCLLLALALMLLLFLMLDETIADALAQRQAVTLTPEQTQFALPPPQTSEPIAAVVQSKREENGIGHAA